MLILTYFSYQSHWQFINWGQGLAIFVPVDGNATGAEFYTSERDTPGNIVFNIVVNVQLRQSQSLRLIILPYLL